MLEFAPLTDSTPTLHICGFYSDFFFFKNKFFKLFISLECKYNMLQFVIRSISIGKQTKAMHPYVYNKTYSKKSIQE